MLLKMLGFVPFMAKMLMCMNGSIVDLSRGVHITCESDVDIGGGRMCTREGERAERRRSAEERK